MPAGREPIPHPTYRRQRNAFLDGYDALDYDEREIMRAFLRLWGSMEASRSRYWLTHSPSLGVRVLGVKTG